MSSTRGGRSGRFRRRDALYNWSLHFGPNMTPMVDVVMVILVFFMASAAFLGPEWYLKSLVPQKPPVGAGLTAAQGKSAADLPPVRLEIVLDLDASGKTVASGAGKTGVSLDEIADALAVAAKGTEQDKIEVLIRPSPKVPYRDVVKLHEAAQRAGISRVGVGMSAGVNEPRNEPRP
ncbi:MAG: ExbD/TolR family protein [Phycisphaerales bacterium]